MTEKQKIFADDSAFKTENYSHLPISPEEMIINSLALLLGEYSVYRKQAALLILKYLLRKEFLENILNDGHIYPYKREDKRVRKWKKDVLRKGKCEVCGATEQLEAHHIIHWSEYPMGRVDVNNGMCLCHKCHTDEHKNERVYNLMISRR